MACGARDVRQAARLAKAVAIIGANTRPGWRAGSRVDAAAPGRSVRADVSGTRYPVPGSGEGRRSFIAASRRDGSDRTGAPGSIGRGDASGGEIRRRSFVGAGRGDGLDGARAVTGTMRGFSLLEMLLVMALIAAIGVLAATALTGGMDGIRLRAAAKEVAAQLRFTRAQAIATGRPQRFTIDPAAHRWTAPKQRRGEIPRGVGIVFTGARDTQPARGVGAIVFFSDGASTGGRIQLGAERAAWNVDVTWLTGEVALRRGEVVR